MAIAVPYPYPSTLSRHLDCPAAVNLTVCNSRGSRAARWWPGMCPHVSDAPVAFAAEPASMVKRLRASNIAFGPICT
jgi:hypothetical protein